MCYIDPCKRVKHYRVSTLDCHISLEVSSSIVKRFPPDGLLTTEPAKHHVDLNPHNIAPDPFASDDRLNDFSPVHPFLMNTTQEGLMMNPGTDELSSGLNVRLRPRRSNIPSPQSTKLVRKSEGKTGQDKAKRTSAASKTPPNKTDDLATKSDSTFLCPYCDKHFASKQTLSKHVRRMHGASSKQDSFFTCLFCSHYEAEDNEIIRHMAQTHSQQYFACQNCHTRLSSSYELAEHKSKACETKLPYRSRLRQKLSTGSMKETQKDGSGNESKVFPDGHSFNGVVISCELKPSQVSDGADIEDNITTNLILPPSKSLGSNSVIEKSAVIVLDDIQWNKRIPPNFSFHNTDADQILSRLGVVHRSPRTGEPTKKDWKNLDETTQKFEKCFDTSFYSKVASNVQENLSKFLDGSFNFNPDPDSTIKTRKSKNSVMINTAEGFPILLASEQYSRNAFDRYMPRAIAPKHKWKWDNLESEKDPINPDQIKRDSHTNNCIISLVSSLDIWTQLRMRRKFEEKFGCPPLEKKTEKQTIISNELKDILESRELPTPSTQVVKMTKKATENPGRGEFPACLGLLPSSSTYEQQPAVLSGEWVRPRCYVCCACGAQSRDSRAVSTHVTTQHPNAQVQHYEIVGEQLLNADILKHLYVPPSQMCNRTRPPRGFRECTKCRKSITLDDLHQHMLDCAGDTPAVRRKCRYRPFGVRRRRPRLPDNTIRKKIRKDIRTRRTRPKGLMRPRPIRTEVGDAETIRKMIADLPAKRHRVLVNPTNSVLRPRIKQRAKILIKRRPSEDRNKRIKRNKEISETRPRPGSPTNDAASVKSDEDNKPLKPKLRRVASKQPRRSEPDKRKTTVLTRTKRPSRQVKRVAKNDNIKDTTALDCNSPENVNNENISIDRSSQRIEITKDFKAKEHAGQGQSNSNNRGGQRPRSGGQNGNSENHCAPAQNVPLKHSIARLTADSEKHDKSVQFHHLFLIQQECNNVNQHVQSGRQLLFENEAAVLTLDKPPLHHSNKGPLDALQKSKLNKPRKGLNACIAMLKNKLVEPATESTIPAGHVSVQCGDDEPLYVKADTETPNTAEYGTNVEIVTNPEKINESSIDINESPGIKTRQSSNQEAKSVETKFEGTDQITPPSLCETRTVPKKQNTIRKRESSRKKSMVNESKTIDLPSESHVTLQAAPEARHAPQSVSPKVVSVSASATPQKSGGQQRDDRSTVTRRIEDTDSSKKMDNSKPNDGQHLAQLIPPVEPYETMKKPGGTQITLELIKPNMSDHEKPENEMKNTTTDQSNVYYGNCLKIQQQADHSGSEYSRKVSADNFPPPEFDHVPVNNRPAHASTHVESIVAIPLDLSGKVVNLNTPQDLLNNKNTYLLGNSYDGYETLDLSNKSQDLKYREENLPKPDDEIVDLSIKSSNLRSTEAEILEKDDVTDLSLKTCVRGDIPTDLTVRKKVIDNAAKSLVDILDNPVSRESTLKKQMTNAEKFAKPQTEIKVQLPPAKPNTQEKQVTGISLTGENITATERTPTSKSNNILMAKETFSEKNFVNVPADLSYQQRSEEKAPSAKYASGKPEPDAHKVEENLSHIHPRTCDTALMQMQKPIYDPTLKIPQYKIRATSTIDNPSNIDLPACALATTTSSLTIPTVSETATNLAHGVSITTSERTTSLNVQDQLAFAYGSVSLNAPSSNTGSIYSITNCGTTSQLGKFESTTPVYTLAKACISVTKIESTNSSTLTNTLLSIPGTTIANTTPVYTLAGTTIGVQGNYSHFASAVPNSAIEKNDGSIVPGTSSQIQAQCEKGFDLHKEKVNNAHVSHMLNVDEDPETARKIALLPKELVDILGNMPIDHRNRLLNILPQYVSTPTSESGLKGELSNHPESASKLEIPCEQKEYNVSGEANNKTESELKVTSPLFNPQQEKHMLGLLNSSSQAKLENMTNIPPTAPPTMLSLSRPNHSESSVITDDFTLRTQRLSKNESPTEALNIKPDLSPEDCIKASITNRPLSLNVLPDKVIDLTEDEAVTRPEIHNNPVVEMLPQMSLLVQPKRNKTNNDQTASLRAVRIKAPSARQRSIDSQLGKCTSMVPVLSNKINNIEQDNEVEKSLQCNVSLNTDISLAIQQAEVSSTQHSNKNVTTESKFPSVISPNLQESNSDETNNCASRLSSASTKEEAIKIDDIHNVQSVVKTTLVTSSVVTNEMNKDLPQVVTKEYSTLSSDLPDTKYIQNMKLDGSSEDSDSSKNNGVITESSILKTLDISKSYDLPIKCSTPKPAVLLGEETPLPLPLKISPESRISVASEDVEDSDDDLSLAVICKQKQQNLLNKGISKEVNISTKEVDIEIKKKEKSKRNVDDILPISDSSLVNNNTVMPISLLKEEPKSTDMGNNAYVTDVSEYNVKQKNSKPRRKNIAKNTKSNITTCDMPPKTDLGSVTINTEHNEVSVVGSVIENSSRNVLDNEHSISTARKRSKVNDDVLQTENITDFSSEKGTIDSKSKASIKQKSTKKKRITISQAESQNSQNLKEKRYEITLCTTVKKSIDVNPSATEPRDTNEIDSKLKSDTEINDSLVQGSSNMENVSVPSDDIPLGPCSSLEEDRNTTTPLRRSKRVRSRNNSVAGEELQVEILQENRTPLTKKQLIFSKLLLDEENNVKNPEGATDGNVENLKKNTESEVAINKLTEAPVAVENMQQNNKSIKRKNTAHFKRKCKKKKPLNSALSCEEDSLQGQAKASAEISHGEQKPSGADERSDHSDMSVISNAQLSETSLAVSIEKRKSGDLSSNVEQSQSSQPKKVKLNTVDNSSEILNIGDDDNAKVEKEKCNKSDKNDTLQRTIDIPKTTTGSKLIENDLRMTTCYNMPAAGRRTRSKSAVIKTVVYDPYDIDMDDMIEHAEPLRQRKISSDYRSTNNVKQITYLKDTKDVTSIDEAKKKEPSRELRSIERSLDFHSNHDGSDSDDSSKSDVPLKKYVEEKEKKASDLTESISTPKNVVENEVNSDLNLSNKNNTVLNRKNRRTLGVCNTGEGIAQDETEEQLRSEQFMESFGFFSERKPRKSNLLATKKISETFHIIANENDDIYGKHKDQNSKKDRKTQNENRKSVESDSNLKGTKQRSPQTKKTAKRGRKKKNSTTVTAPSYCHICKKDFRRSDNFLRHQMTLLHVSKMSEVEMKIKTVTIQEEPNYLLAYKEHLDRLKVITDKMLKRKKNSKSTPKISPLSLEEILADVNKIAREQQHSHRGLSCDEELFLDCCELLKESHKKQDPVTDIPPLIKDSDGLCPSEAANVGLDLLGKTDIDVKSDNKNDGDVDSITAKTILESEEVRNLENDLISGLKEAANASSLNKSNIDYQQTVSDEDTCHLQDFSDNLSSPAATESQYEQLSTYDESVELKNKKYPEFKEKMYPDVEEFDMFEDKFDKIKRKCRSQAAAAKQPQLVVEPSISRKGRKKSDKKKIKKSSKKNHPNTVLTKGALKGFDGIKVSIPTSDINISAIVSPLECSHKKKKKGTTRKKRENKNSESSSKYDSDHPLNDSSTSLKNVDVYEFMDNEDVELFEFRPSTLMERFKSITNKETPSTFNANPVVEEPENSSASASDGDDFVYMSDDYVCSDDETENSLMSCDVSNTKLPADAKKLSSQIKKRDAIEKNAVMGKIFKNNAVRSEKKLTKSKEPAKPKANLDQLFDSLLEDEPSSSMLNDESLPPRDDSTYTSKFESQIVSPSRSEEPLSKYEQNQIKKKNNLTTEKQNYTLKYKNMSSDNDDDEEPSSFIDYGPSTSKLSLKSFMGDHTSTKPGMRPSLSPPEVKPVSPKKCDTSQKHHSLLKKQERMSFVPDDYFEDTGILRKRNDGPKKDDSKSHERSPARKIDDDFGVSNDYNDIGDQTFTSDETGVARQRARRKCTVGKQNILAETWSSESEPDGGPPRPNSAESMASGSTRKKKGKKKDRQHSSGRRTNNRHNSIKKQEIASRVSSSIRNNAVHTTGTNSGAAVSKSPGSTLGTLASERSEPSSSAASTSGATSMCVEEPTGGPSTSSCASTISSPSAGPSTSTEGAAAEPAEPTFLVPAEPGTSGGPGRPRTLYYWSSDGSDSEQVREALAREQREREEAQQQQQQHGWIVGDSHKKLVTMLAHAKGRKRNNDDKRHKSE